MKEAMRALWRRWSMPRGWEADRPTPGDVVEKAAASTQAYRRQQLTDPTLAPLGAGQVRKFHVDREVPPAVPNPLVPPVAFALSREAQNAFETQDIARMRFVIALIRYQERQEAMLVAERACANILSNPASFARCRFWPLRLVES